MRRDENVTKRDLAARYALGMVQLSSRVRTVARFVFTAGLLGAMLFFTVATQPAIPRVRGEVTVTDRAPHRGPVDARAAHVIVIGDEEGRFVPTVLHPDKDGRATWPRIDNGYRLVVGHRHAGGLSVARPGIEGEREREGVWKVVLLADGDEVARVPLYLVAEGHADPVELSGTHVTLRDGPDEQWVVFAWADGRYLVERVTDARGQTPRMVPLPPGFRGEVFSVWGSYIVERGATTPLRVGVVGLKQ